MRLSAREAALPKWPTDQASSVIRHRIISSRGNKGLCPAELELTAPEEPLRPVWAHRPIPVEVCLLVPSHVAI